MNRPVSQMILVVDDDPDFLDQVKRAFVPESAGGVLFAGNAKQALILMDKLGSAVTLAMIDLNLPGVDGFALITKMREGFPDLPIIAISGVVRDTALESARLVGATEVLPKPITTEWAAAVERVRRLARSRNLS